MPTEIQTTYITLRVAKIAAKQNIWSGQWEQEITATWMFLWQGNVIPHINTCSIQNMLCFLSCIWDHIDLCCISPSS